MSWSFRLGKIRGIDVYIHFTFVLLLGFVGLSIWLQTHEIVETLAGVGFLAALFACVLLHELGHALMAAKFDIKTRDITLLPIGGLARLERIPEKPMQEFWVALAGPAVNVVIAAVLLIYLLATSQFEIPENLGLTGGAFVARLAVVNVILVIFNMIPAFPMDGGRVLRALLAMRLDYVLSTEIAARLGQYMAVVFALVGLLWNPFLVLIALFIWIGAAQEFKMVQFKSALSGLPLKNVMITEFHTLAPTDPLSSGVEHVLRGFQHDFPVLNEGRLVGLLTRNDLITSLAKLGPGATVEEAMSREFPTVDPHEPLENALALLQESNHQSLPILDHGRLVGILTMENLVELLMVQAALRGKPPPISIG